MQGSVNAEDRVEEGVAEAWSFARPVLNNGFHLSSINFILLCQFKFNQL